jgi:hypothetical protein
MGTIVTGLFVAMGLPAFTAMPAGDMQKLRWQSLEHALEHRARHTLGTLGVCGCFALHYWTKNLSATTSIVANL